MKKFTGKPYAGKPHVRIDEGAGKVFLSFPLYSTEFYQQRLQKSTEERKIIINIQNSLAPVKAIDNQLKGYFSGLSWLKWTPKK